MSNTPVVFHLEEDEHFAHELASSMHWKQGQVDFHTFPDGETSIQLQSRVKEADVYLVANLHQPDAKLIKLIFFAEAVRANGAIRVILIAPYLSYLRLDEIRSTGQG
nr:ribose-phosphate pyrophosphokinase-like domain-containing protein [Pseudomonadota bacterium]